MKPFTIRKANRPGYDEQYQDAKDEYGKFPFPTLQDSQVVHFSQFEVDMSCIPLHYSGIYFIFQTDQYPDGREGSAPDHLMEGLTPEEEEKLKPNPMKVVNPWIHEATHKEFLEGIKVRFLIYYLSNIFNYQELTDFYRDFLQDTLRLSRSIRML